MSTINSEWLLKKLKVSALKAPENQPEQRLVELFELLTEMPIPTANASQALSCENQETERAALLLYLTKLGKQAGLQAPESFAQQIYLMANNAFIQQQGDPSCNALYHAKQAASALIRVQRKPDWLQNTQQYLSIKPVQYGLAATFSGLVGTGIVLGYQAAHPHAGTAIVAIAEAATQLEASQNTSLDNSIASPDDTAEMYATIEKMRDGRCRYIEALQLPTAQQGLYLQNVVAGQVSNKASEQKTARELMGKVTCDYTPMLMKNSRG